MAKASFLPFRQPQQLLRGCFWSTGTWRSRRWRRRKRLSPQSYWVNFPTLLVLSLSSERINFLSLGVCSWGEGTLRNVPRPAKSGTGIFLQSDSVFLFLKIQFYTRDHQPPTNRRRSRRRRQRPGVEESVRHVAAIWTHWGRSLGKVPETHKIPPSYFVFLLNLHEM